MSKKVDICDICGDIYPEYHFRHKFWWLIRRMWSMEVKSVDMCSQCYWDMRDFITQRNKKRK